MKERCTDKVLPPKIKFGHVIIVLKLNIPTLSWTCAKGFLLNELWIFIPLMLLGYGIGFWFYALPILKRKHQDRQILQRLQTQKVETKANAYMFAASPDWCNRYKTSLLLGTWLYAFLAYGLPVTLLYHLRSNLIIGLSLTWAILGTWLMLKSWKQSKTLLKLSQETSGKELLLYNNGIQISILILAGVPGRKALRDEISSTTISWGEVISVTFDQVRFGSGSPVEAITVETKTSTEPYYIKRYALGTSTEELAKAFQHFQSLYGFDVCSEKSWKAVCIFRSTQEGSGFPIKTHTSYPTEIFFLFAMVIRMKGIRFVLIKSWRLAVNFKVPVKT